MSRIARIVVLVTALTSLFAVVSSTAGAVTWTNTGGGSFHAVGGAGTFSHAGNSISCSGSTATGMAPFHSILTTYKITGTVKFSPCTMFGLSSYVHCGFTLTGATWSNATPPAQTTGVADVTCVAATTASSTAFCHIAGTTPFVYINPSSPNAGRITLTTSAGGLTVTDSAHPCLLGTGGAHLSEQTLTVTSFIGSPVITRNA